jgi:hypothetical protein
MTLHRIKNLYCITAIAIGLLLASAGGVVCYVAAIVVLAGALPMFRAVSGATKRQTLRSLASDLGVDLDSHPVAIANQDHRRTLP